MWGLATTAICFAADNPKECLVIPTSPTLAEAGAFATAPGNLAPDEEISSIQVKLETDTGIFAGTTDDVWFDIGPRAWKIGDDFGQGTTKTLNIKVKDGFFENPAGGVLRVRDISVIRIEKKGICGLTNAPDSLLDLAFPGGATPANLLPSARTKAEDLQQQVSSAQKVLESHMKLIADEQAAIDKASTLYGQAIKAQADLQNRVIDLNNSIQQKQLDIQRGVILHFENVVETYQEKTCSLWGWILVGPAPCLAYKLETKTRIVQRVTQAYLDAQQFILDQQKQVSEIAKQVNDLQAQINAQAAQKAAHLATLQQLIADKSADVALAAAQTALDEAKKYASDLDDLAKKAAAGLEVPQPGQWALRTVTVVVNGKVFGRYEVNERLKRYHPSTTIAISHSAPEEQFVFGLRGNINHQSAHADEAASGFTTPFFKDNGISGWESRPLSSGTVVGTLCHPFSAGADGFVSLDLEVEEVEARGRTFTLSEVTDLPRYLRIEYAHGADTRFTSWAPGTRLRISGPVEWDTDQYGFYELHPVRAS